MLAQNARFLCKSFDCLLLKRNNTLVCGCSFQVRRPGQNDPRRDLMRSNLSRIGSLINSIGSVTSDISGQTTHMITRDTDVKPSAKRGRAPNKTITYLRLRDTSSGPFSSSLVHKLQPQRLISFNCKFYNYLHFYLVMGQHVSTILQYRNFSDLYKSEIRTN